MNFITKLVLFLLLVNSLLLIVISVRSVIRSQDIELGKTIVIDNASYKCNLIHDLKDD